MADVLIRSFSKILSLLVGPTNVAIDNWTFQMFYKVRMRRRNLVTIMIWLANENDDYLSFVYYFFYLRFYSNFEGIVLIILRLVNYN